MKYTKRDIDFTALHNTRVAKKANGDDLGSNDGKNWAIATNNRAAFKIIVHVNFNGTLCNKIIFNEFNKG